MMDRDPDAASISFFEADGMGAGDTLVEIKKRNLAQETTGVDLMQIENSNSIVSK